MAERQKQMKYHKPNESGTDYKANEAANQAAEDAQRQKAARVAGEVAVEGVADLLEEIDSILEVNGEEMAMNFVQKGGQ